MVVGLVLVLSCLMVAVVLVTIIRVLPRLNPEMPEWERLWWAVVCLSALVVVEALVTVAVLEHQNIPLPSGADSAAEYIVVAVASWVVVPLLLAFWGRIRHGTMAGGLAIAWLILVASLWPIWVIM